VHGRHSCTTTPILATVESLELSPVELRVVGSLVEKHLTTPDQYPLTLNALVLACNQKSSREPVVNLAESTVQSAVTSAKTKALVRFVHPSHGRSVLRYAHTLDDALDVSQRQLALLAVMMLRGPQTLNELRVRTNRMAEFSDLDDLERELDRLSGRETPLVERQGRRPGQKEDRYAHLLGSGRSDESAGWPEESRTSAGGGGGFDAREEVGGYARTGDDELSRPEPRRSQPDTGDLTEQIAEIREELAQLRQELSELRHQLGD
jgi:uncharacterized protein YceH (UPF0502 family)